MVESLEDLNEQWKRHVLENRLLLLLEVGELMRKFLESFRFDMPNYHVVKGQVRQIPEIKTWDIVLLHDDWNDLLKKENNEEWEEYTINSTAFLLGSKKYYSEFGTQETKWYANFVNGQDGQNCYGETISEYLFYEIDNRLDNTIDKLFDSFYLREKIEMLA